MSNHSETFPKNPNKGEPWVCPKWLREAAEFVFFFLVPILAFAALMIGFTIMRDADRRAPNKVAPLELEK